MFEITYSNDDFYTLAELTGNDTVHEKAKYMFTFQNKYIVYNVDKRTKAYYFAIEKTTGVTVLVNRIDKKDKELMLPEQLVPLIIDAVKDFDKSVVALIEDCDPMEVIDAIFYVVLPSFGYTVRKEQVKLCKDMYNGFTNKQVSLCEAEVGTGKTLAYLVAGIVAKKMYEKEYGIFNPVTITTSSIELQSSIVHKEIPKLSSMLLRFGLINRPLEVVLRKGKEHYVCEKRLKSYFDTLDKEKKSETRATLIELVKKTFGIDLDKYAFPNWLKGKVCVKDCIGCKDKQMCKYQSYIRNDCKSHTLDFQVTNHNLFLASKKNESIDKPAVLRTENFVIIDEAHKFREAAETTYGECIDENTIRTYINAVKILHGNKNVSNYKTALCRLDALNEKLFSLFKSQFRSEDEDGERKSRIDELSVKQKEIIDRILNLISQIEKARVPKNEVNSLVHFITNTLRGMNGYDKIIWVDIDEHEVISVSCTPKNIRKVMWNCVWNKDISYVLTSGTMSDGTNFDYFKKDNGLNTIPSNLIFESRFEAPFDYGKNACLYIPELMPNPTEENYEEYINILSEHIYRLIKATCGRTAILFTSYKALALVHEKLKDKLDEYEVFCMSRSNSNAIAAFKQAKNGILFASGSMWEGVDCAGDCLSSVIIVRLPFPIRTALLEVKKGKYPHLEMFLDDYCVPNMLIKLRQGGGRLIRTETDTGVLSILDARASSRGRYRQSVLDAFKKYPLVHSIEEVEKHMKRVKDKSYFEEVADGSEKKK